MRRISWRSVWRREFRIYRNLEGIPTSQKQHIVCINSKAISLKLSINCSPTKIWFVMLRTPLKRSLESEFELLMYLINIINKTDNLILSSFWLCESSLGSILNLGILQLFTSNSRNFITCSWRSDLLEIWFFKMPKTTKSRVWGNYDSVWPWSTLKL